MTYIILYDLNLRLIAAKDIEWDQDFPVDFSPPISTDFSPTFRALVLISEVRGTYLNDSSLQKHTITLTSRFKAQQTFFTHFGNMFVLIFTKFHPDHKLYFRDFLLKTRFSSLFYSFRLWFLYFYLFSLCVSIFSNFVFVYC